MDELAFYKRIEVPPPTLGPLERQRRRLVWRDERFLHHGACHFCQKKLVTVYPPEVKFPVLCAECFWSDHYDPLQYGREFDFNRPFFDQFHELHDAAPQLAIFQSHCVNSDYSINCVYDKNCYMMSGADYNEDCMYGLNTQRSKDCVDHILIYDCQLCYGCIWSSKLYQCVGCQDSENCTDSWFLFDCKGSSSCAFSSNLRNKQYVFENVQLTKEEYEKKLAEKLKEIFNNPAWLYENLARVRGKAIQRASMIVNGENVSGNYIRNSKNAHDVYDAEDLEDVHYAYYALSVKDSCDLTAIGWARQFYECVSGGLSESVFFSTTVLDSHDIWYSRSIWNCSDIFGSTSLKNHLRFVIFNKQYSQEEFHALRELIIEHMKKTNEYGEFFPPHLSPFEYNRSMAIDHMPLAREEALKLGFRWHDEDTSKSAMIDASLPICANCGKNFLIIEQETNFYKRINIPTPKLCWPCRVQNLLAQRRPYELFERSCSKCTAPIQTSLRPSDLATVYCEECYLEAVY